MLVAAKHTRLLLVRHAATALNLEGRYQGRHDEPLHADSQAQLEQLRIWLSTESIDVVVHSGSQRTLQTAQAIAPSVSIEADSRWREIDHGRWEGLSYADVREQWLEAAQKHWADPWSVPAPEGETLSSVYERVSTAARALLEEHTGKSILLVTHATPLQLLMCLLLEAPLERYWRWKFDLASLSCVDMYPTGTILNWHNRGYQPPPAC